MAGAVLRYWHLASLDAPTVAAVWSLAFAWTARVRLAWWVLALQVLAVWTVYVADRLLDARTALRRRDHSGLRERHFFHWRHRRALAPMAVAAAAACAWIALRWMPIHIGERDSVLAAASLIYFARVHGGNRRRLFPKEALVGALFTIGCALPVWARAQQSLMVPIAFFAVLAWLNCRAIERWESGVGSSTSSSRIAWQVSIIGLVAAGLLLPAHDRAALTIAAAAASAVLLAILDRTRQRISAVTLRTAADLVLLTPAILLILAGRR